VEKGTKRCEHALADMISSNSKLQSILALKREFRSKYLGKISDSNTTTSSPSWASAEAAYEPPGPPPTTRTLHACGIDMISYSDT
jgi:hypothetical protein